MFLSIMILAVSLSLDALGLGLVYGLRQIKIPLLPKMVICFFSIFYSGVSLMIGKSFSSILNPSVSKFIGVLILTLMGIWVIVQALLRKDDDASHSTSNKKKERTIFKIPIKSLGITVQIIRDPVKGDIDKSGSIDISESLLLGFALSVDAIGVGIGSGLAGFHSMAIPFTVGLFQLCFLYIGTFLGEKFTLIGKINKKVLALLPGILLIFLAVLRM